MSADALASRQGALTVTGDGQTAEPVMQPTIDFNDPRSTAAAAIEMAPDLAYCIRSDLPFLLGSRSPGGLGVIAGRMRDVFDPFTSASLTGVLADCAKAIAAHTTVRTEWVVARDIGGDEELEPRTIQELDEVAIDLQRVSARIRTLLALVSRTNALLEADRQLGSRR